MMMRKNKKINKTFHNKKNHHTFQLQLPRTSKQPTNQKEEEEEDIIHRRSKVGRYLVAGSTTLRAELSGATTSETGVLMALAWSAKQSSLAKKATISNALRIPTNLCCLLCAFSNGLFTDLFRHTGIPPSAESPMAPIAAATVSVSRNSDSSGFPTVRSPTTWYRNTEAMDEDWINDDDDE